MSADTAESHTAREKLKAVVSIDRNSKHVACVEYPFFVRFKGDEGPFKDCCCSQAFSFYNSVYAKGQVSLDFGHPHSESEPNFCNAKIHPMGS
jgi:hypothetical protein